jgi:membrane protein DedA with SNARE-associated domain
MLYFLSLFGLAAVTGAGIGGPGDAALVAAAVLASQGHTSLAAVLISAYLGWLLGRGIGYVVGIRGGRPLMERPGRLHDYRMRIVTKGDRLFEKYPRIAPLVAPAPISGINKVTWPIFGLASLVAALAWTLSTGLIAYFFGQAGIDYAKNLGGKGIAVVIVLAAIALLYRYLWQRRRPKETDATTACATTDVTPKAA